VQTEGVPLQHTRRQQAREHPTRAWTELGEGLAQLQSRYDTGSYPWYGLRVARIGKVLVVVESTGIPIRVTSPGLLTAAVDRALPLRWDAGDVGLETM
jgi:hypothetical protein